MGAHVTIGGTDYPVIFDDPGEQANLLQLTAETNPALLQFYGVIEGDAVPDRKITYNNLVQALLPYNNIRVGAGISCNGTDGQTINFDTELAGTPSILLIFDYQGKGITRVSYTSTGFVINSLEVGLFDYLAIYLP